MQKIMVCLERPSKFDRMEWFEGISDHLKSYSRDYHACYFGIEDQYVEQGADIRLENSRHPKNAVLSIWLENVYSLDHFYADIGTLGRAQGYTVVEYRRRPFKLEPGRTPGFCQTCFLKKPKTHAHQQWLDLWLGESTQISLQTQSSYSLVQNITTTPFPISTEQPDEWLLMRGIVQDYFLTEAMHSREAFYSAKGDSKKYLANEQKLISSCLRFIDFDHFDCIPMSQYVIKACDW